MTEKEKLLNTTYAKFMDIGLSINPSYHILEELAVEDVMGFGTAVDEKLFTLSALRELLITQEKLLKGVETKWERTPVLRHIAADGNSAVFADDIIGTMMVENETMQMYLRFSSVMEFIGNSWMLVHWHGSKPENVQSEVDGFGIDKWKQRNAELEKLVDEKTVDLIIKNRELEIETALERVRAIALSMKEPSDMLDVCRIISQQSESLGIKEIRNVQTVIINELKGTYVNYQYFAAYDQGIVEEVDYHKHPTVKEMAEKMISSPDAFFTGNFEGQELEKFRTYRKLDNQLPDPILDKASTLDFYFYSIGPGGLGLSTYKPLSEAGLDVFKQFHKVFSLAYRRFLDLQKAEAQAREAKLETALERVRSRTMAMYKSEEVMEVAVTMYEELKKLDFAYGACTIIIIDKNTGNTEHWVAGFNQKKYPESFFVKYFNHPFYKKQISCWKAGEKYAVIKLEGKSKISYDNIIFTETDFKNFPEEGKGMMRQMESVTFSIAFLEHGALTWGPGAISEEAGMVLQRFAKVFEQTYTRFLDLQKAEAQAREAEIELSLERVRSKAMAMRNSSEIGNLIHHLYTELTQLDAQLDRCFIMIVNPENYGITWWLAGKEGLLNENGFFIQNNTHPSHILYLNHWKNCQKKWQYVFEGKEKAEWDHFGFLETGLAKLPEAIKQDMACIGKIYLSGSSDNFGCLVTGSLFPLSADHEDIICRFSIVFNQTFTRFLDLQRAEAQAYQAEQDLIAIKEARQNAEEALKELQATQKQLIQSEKMASLGELTAGIAHEIQNPLNFVNNFSEVNRELIGEMKTELKNGNIEEVNALADDIEANEEKINHHGKRADAIVKGMLQHSRTSSGQKEQTDINLLADEYLRLSYHGLRAKDKSFNADFKTELDETLPKINVIPQDIGRVLLNLINNAFYAVDKKGKEKKDGYKPEVIVSTRKLEKSIEVSVRDNGDGIPSAIKEKIFQPFFTTKPTGQGTGLGLSLSYDIIKAHGGELRVETKEGKKSEFIILLPV